MSNELKRAQERICQLESELEEVRKRLPEEVKPCPFCGSFPRVSPTHISCETEDCLIAEVYDSAAKDLGLTMAQMWNRRVK